MWSGAIEPDGKNGNEKSCIIGKSGPGGKRNDVTVSIDWLNEKLTPLRGCNKNCACGAFFYNFIPKFKLPPYRQILISTRKIIVVINFLNYN